MKKFFAFAAVASMVALASCGNADEAAKKMADSMRQDSIMKANAKDSADKAMMAKQKQDSMDNAAKMAAQKRMDDSVKMADSMAKMKGGAKKPAGGNKPKPTKAPVAGKGKG